MNSTKILSLSKHLFFSLFKNDDNKDTIIDNFHLPLCVIMDFCFGEPQNDIDRNQDMQDSNCNSKEYNPQITNKQSNKEHSTYIETK